MGVSGTENVDKNSTNIYMLAMPTIIMLHHVSDAPEHDSLKPYSISHQSFLQLLDYLENKKISTLIFKDMLKRSSWNFFANEVILTFDDCPKHLWDFAIPELIKRKMKAVFYMPTAHIGGTNNWDLKDGRYQVQLMDEDDLKKLHHLGMEIGSHAHEHVRLADIKDSNEVSRAFLKSKKILESLIGENIVSMAYPFGAVPTNYASLLANTGYLFATAIYHPKGDVYALRRTIYHDGDTVKSLKRKLSLFYRLYRFCSDRFKKAS